MKKKRRNPFVELKKFLRREEKDCVKLKDWKGAVAMRHVLDWLRKTQP